MLFTRLCAVASLCLLVAVGIAVEEDRRPRVLFVGGMQSTDVRSRMPWIDYVAERHPQWRFMMDINERYLYGPSQATPRYNHHNERVADTIWPGTDDYLSQTLDRHADLALVVIFLGTANARADMIERIPAADYPAIAKRMIETLVMHPSTAEAQIVIMTPMPVVTAHLDRWSVDTFAGGESAIRDLAGALRQAASKHDRVMIHDTWQRAWDDLHDGAPGRLVSNTGHVMLPWAQRVLADEMGPLFRQWLESSIGDQQLSDWHRHAASKRALDQILSATSSGVIDHGEALSVTQQVHGEGDDIYGGHAFHVVQIPQGLMVDGRLDLVLKPAVDGALASVAVGNAVKSELPELRIPTANGVIAIKARAVSSRLVDQARPDEVIPMDRYGVNKGRWRALPVASSHPGQQRWVLFSLVLPEGITPVGPATLRFRTAYSVRYFQQYGNGVISGANHQGPWVPMAVHPLLGVDRDWSSLTATWHQRQGGLGWSGGTIDRPARRVALEAFLAESHPPAVLERAQALLADLEE